MGLNPGPQARGGPASDSPGDIFSLLPRTQEVQPGARRDWSAPVDLLDQAAEAIRAYAEQAEKMEARARALWAHATEEIERGQARIKDFEARLHASEARVEAAESQVAVTREWARRIQDVIGAELSVGRKMLGSRVSLVPPEANPSHEAGESTG